MNKLFAVLFAASLCACAAAPKPVVVAPVVEDTSPLRLEVAGLGHVSAVRCTDELQCIQRLGGLCVNGFSGGDFLHGTNGAVVGVLFNCITNEEKAAHEAALVRRAAEEKAWQEERAARIAAAKAELARATTPATCALPAKKPAKK